MRFEDRTAPGTSGGVHRRVTRAGRAEVRFAAGRRMTDGLAILAAWAMFGLLVAVLVFVVLHGGRKQ